VFSRLSTGLLTTISFGLLGLHSQDCIPECRSREAVQFSGVVRGWSPLKRAHVCPPDWCIVCNVIMLVLIGFQWLPVCSKSYTVLDVHEHTFCYSSILSSDPFFFGWLLQGAPLSLPFGASPKLPYLVSRALCRLRCLSFMVPRLPLGGWGPNQNP
jgi:hypothetical protein